jgi:hypothetical protein
MVIELAVITVEEIETFWPLSDAVPTPGLNSKFVGAERINVIFVPVLKLLFCCSDMTILGKE